MARKSKQVSRKRKAQMPEEDEKANESILEEVLSISGKNVEKSDGTSCKNVEKSDGSPPTKQKRTANKSNEATTCSPKKLNAKKRSASPLPTSPSKQKKSEKGETANTAVNEVKASTLKRGDPVPNLPDGWRRQVVVRKSGKSAGQLDIYFYSPEGIKLRSRPDVASYLKKHKCSLEIEEFDFSRAAKVGALGKLVPAENSKGSKKKTKTTQEEKSKVGVEAKDSSKSPSAKVAAEGSPSTDVEDKKNDAAGKSNKVLTEEMNNTIEMNGKQKEKTSPTKKRKPQILEESEEQKEAISEDTSSKKVEKADGSPPARLKRSASKSNEEISTPPKKFNAKQKDSTDEEVEDNAVNNELKVSEKGDPVPNFPDGWKRQVVARKSGEKSGRTDIYFYSPEGIKLRSRPDVASYLKKHKCDLKMEDFDFSRPAKTNEAVVKNKPPAENSSVPKKKNKTVQDEKSKVGEESKESTEKVCDEVPPDDPEEKEEDADGKPNKVLRLILENKSSRKTRR